MLLTIALDGPVGAGKSSVADGVAQKLGILHLDTGAMYRAFAWKALQEGVSLEDEAALKALTEASLPEVRYENGGQHTYMDGQDVTGLIRTPEVSMARQHRFQGGRRAPGHGSAPAGAGLPAEHAAGRPGHRHPGAAQRHGEILPDRLAGDSRPPPLR